ncbi:hypothetical protein DTL42_14645 [Bremerella cremea]|uniref:Carboxypeptidase regulatory-like domain-containing protein n=1 Tax=Bremerella cremea TaxID=1031537 RepID=A0A368KTL3_9BACT|nr:hypothetical protein [Bremerella cremea]RCS47752.1 hypothetical protein DTL42_14645 [Bremerella cremea]
MTKPLSLLVLLLIAAVGCGSAGPEMGDVKGTVTYKGKPLTTGTITFVPETDGLPNAFAEIQTDGTYVAQTRDFGNGVPVGKHRVMIIAVKDHGPEAPVEAILPVKYSSDSQSGLKAEVSAGENIIDFPL